MRSISHTLRIATLLTFAVACCLWSAGCKTSGDATAKPSIAGSSPSNPTIVDVPVKDTEEEKQLIAIASSIGTQSEELQKILQTAQTELQAKNAPIEAAMRAKTSAEQKQIDDNNRQAYTEYQQKAGALQNQVATANIKIQTLVDVVRRQQNLPANAQFDPRAHKWTVPAK